MICWTCKHPVSKHELSVPECQEYGNHYCFECSSEAAKKRDGSINWDIEDSRKMIWHDLKTNLDYVEDLAKERNLI